jgi:putative holliday junction resolvase
LANLIVAFDFGLKHIGVAVGQSITGSASPVTTLRARNGRPDWNALKTLVEHWQPSDLVVGLPLNMDDSESEMSKRARDFAAELGRQTRLPVHLVDERLSSFEAKQLDNQDNHAVAATLIAQTWLGQQ